MTKLTADVCRVTVVAGDRRIDLAVPATVTVSELLPTLVASAAESAHDGGWVLQRIGGAPFDPTGTPESLDWLEGEELYLRPVEDSLPELDFDDLADGIATAVNRRADRWQPEYRRPLFLVLTVVALGVFGAVLIGGGTIAFTGVAGLLAGTGLLAAGLSSARPGRDRAMSTVFSAGGIALLVLTGTEVVHALGLSAQAGLTVPGLAGLLATTGLVMVVSAPKAALRLARLRGVQLPKSGEELHYDNEPQPAGDLEARTDAADGYLTTVVLSACLLMPYLQIEIMRAGGWIGWSLVTVLSGALALRARSFFGAGQRLALVAAATTGFVLVVAHLSGNTGPLARSVLLAGLAVLLGVLVMAATRPWPRRLLPIWEFLAGAGDVITGVALIPLLLQLLGAYAWARGLFG
ncbi:hypothetical protein GCM10010435_40990 [Winogradskya consettensis]|uniref:EccD-like transmembrane domain-containing protein n=1 Tax=Winogradskya consettensis TaxID=113560 RepID=A0A919SDG4_9ACTN|nr:EsaB/YukD family protein [Actinoplanes consettensis]GIM69801.1 hypothetical protein Aco04nite_17120 [Actinoplanes consettensis]